MDEARARILGSNDTSGLLSGAMHGGSCDYEVVRYPEDGPRVFSLALQNPMSSTEHDSAMFATAVRL